MQFVSVRDLRSKSAEVWKKLSVEKELVITSKGRPIAIMSPVGGEDFEQLLGFMRKARSMAAVEAMHLTSVKAGTSRMTAQEINAEIKKDRRTRIH